MPSLEEFNRKFFSDSRWLGKIIVGGLLTLSVVGMPLVLGYFYRYAEQIRLENDLELPNWIRWEQLFVDGIKMFCIAAIFVLAPLAVILVFGWLLECLLGSWSGIFMLGMFSGFMVIVPPWCVAGILYFQRTFSLRSLLEWKTQQAITRMMVARSRKLLLPILAYNGLLLVGAPVFVFVFFLGTNLLLAYLIVIFSK